MARAKKQPRELTDVLVQGIEPGSRDIYISDSVIAGFRLKVTPKGKRVLYFQYAAPDGRQRKLALGTAKTASVKQARGRAVEASHMVATGQDPQAAQDNVKMSPTLQSAFNLYEQKHIIPNLKASTAKEYRRMFNVHVPDRLKNMKVIAIKRPYIADLIGDMRDTPYVANRLRALLKAFFKWCEGDGGLIEQGTSPAQNVRGYSEKSRSFLFDAASLSRLGAALKEAETVTEWPPAIAAIRLLLLTGLRKGEALELRWDEVDLPNRCLRLAEAGRTGTLKTGARHVALGAGAVALLDDLDAKRNAMPSPFVFPSPKDRGRHFVGIQKVWSRVRKKADIGDVRLHDLRHNFGGVGATKSSAVHVKGLLGHKQLSTTDRYMNISHQPLHDAADAVTEDIAAGLEPANVVRLKGGQ